VALALKKKKPGPPARLLHFPHSPESNEAIYGSEKGKSPASSSYAYKKRQMLPKSHLPLRAPVTARQKAQKIADY
jgi:hypothetical protein